MFCVGASTDCAIWRIPIGDIGLEGPPCQGSSPVPRVDESGGARSTVVQMDPPTDGSRAMPTVVPGKYLCNVSLWSSVYEAAETLGERRDDHGDPVPSDTSYFKS